MKAPLVVAAAFLCLALDVHASEVFGYPPSPSGGLITSSWVSPNGSDADMYAWDDFTLSRTQSITEVRWRGGYAYGAAYGHVSDFTVAFFASTAGNTQPLVTNPEFPEPYLASYHVGGNAGETPAGVAGGVQMYDYAFRLPTPFVATGGVKYWIRIEGYQSTVPDWGLSMGTGGDGSYFRFSTGMAMFQFVPGDTSFRLLARWADLGSAKAGVNGSPSLAGTGALTPSSAGTLTLVNAANSSTAFLALGANAMNVPFMGGVLVPNPQVVAALATDATGKITSPFTIPAGTPAGIDAWVQYWIADATATHGYSASNALLATTQ